MLGERYYAMLFVSRELNGRFARAPNMYANYAPKCFGAKNRADAFALYMRRACHGHKLYDRQTDKFFVYSLRLSVGKRQAGRLSAWLKHTHTHGVRQSHILARLAAANTE